MGRPGGATTGVDQNFRTAETAAIRANTPPMPSATSGAFEVSFFRNASLGSSGSTYAVVRPPGSYSETADSAADRVSYSR